VVLDRGGPLAALLLSSSLTAASFLALLMLRLAHDRSERPALRRRQPG
jgi:hypothetical protein